MPPLNVKCPDQANKSRETESRLVVTRGWGVTAEEDGSLSWEDRSVLELNRGDGWTARNVLRATEVFTFGT